jgi:ankyrin repeat protein
MKRRRALLLSLTVVLALFAACGVWLHVQKQQYDRNRALIAALEKDDFQTALVLVNAGADPNTRQAPTPAPTLSQLLKHLLHHARPPANDSPPALTLACYKYMKAGVFLNETADVAEAKLPLFRAMLSHGANVNARAGNAGTALEGAISNRIPHLMELLLERGADANIRDRVGMTPLMWVATLGWTQEVHLLLAHGANPNLQDKYGNTALYFALPSPNPKDLIPELLAHGADPNLPNKQGTTPLTLAQKEKRPDLVRLLKGGTK